MSKYPCSLDCPQRKNNCSLSCPMYREVRDAAIAERLQEMKQSGRYRETSISKADRDLISAIQEGRI